MTGPIDYYRKYYSKYYNYEAIKRHMIKKKIYSPSDFRYYCNQMIKELKKKLKPDDYEKSLNVSDEMLDKFEKEYFENSINFLFNNDTKKSNTSFFNNILEKLKIYIDKVKINNDFLSNLPNMNNLVLPSLKTIFGNSPAAPTPTPAGAQHIVADEEKEDKEKDILRNYMLYLLTTDELNDLNELYK